MDDPEITSELAEITDGQNELNDDNANSGITRPWRPQDADKEVIREAIRRRVRTSSVADNAIFYPAKPKPTINDTDDKRVAVYARVSSKSTEQVSSIENQTKTIQKRYRKPQTGHCRKYTSMRANRVHPPKNELLSIV